MNIFAPTIERCSLVVRLRLPAWKIGFAVIVCLGLALFETEPLQAQEGPNRRGQLKTPGLVVDGAGPTGTCRELVFSDDGAWVFAAGDDKIVRCLTAGAGLDDINLRKLRWATWKEQRGRILAVAVSPDPGNRFIAVAGQGLWNGAAVVIDRETGEIVHALGIPPRNAQAQSGAVITSLDFSPDGRVLTMGSQEGDVYFWPLEASAVIPVGGHGERSHDLEVKLVRFVAPDVILSVCRNGQFRRWRLLEGQPAVSQLVWDFRAVVERARISKNGQSVAVALNGSVGGRAKFSVAVVSLVDGRQWSPRFDQRFFPRSLALSADGSRVAVGLDVASRGEAFAPLNSYVTVQSPGENEARLAPPFRGADCLAFSPDGGTVAIAGGDDFELALCNVANGLPVGRSVQGPGKTLWSVGLSRDGLQIGYRTSRNSAPKGFNDQGAGPWEVFDLNGVKPVDDPAGFQPIPPRNAEAGWRVQPRDLLHWDVVNPQGGVFPLNLNVLLTGYPRCYTFLPAARGKPVRLAVGHTWGFSLFDLSEAGPVLRRTYVGHQSEVVSIAPSSGGDRLITGSRDQTIALWRLNDWAFEPDLGAAFAVDGRELVVTGVADGSPAWEAGLSVGDRVARFQHAGKGDMAGGPGAWLQALQNPAPLVECLFHLARPGAPGLLPTLTTIKQRPLWKFFPGRDREWVIWLWREQYYETSTRGDYLVGWQINGDVDKTPEFHPLEQYRNLFHKPNELRAALTGRKAAAADPAPAPSIAPIEKRIVQLTPPKPVLVLASADESGVEVNLSFDSQDPRATQNLSEITLWVNDYRYRQWKSPSGSLTERIRVPADLLRSGENRLIAQVYNIDGARADAVDVAVQGPERKSKPSLYGLFVGVEDYSKSHLPLLKPGQKDRPWRTLVYCKRDAQELMAEWKAQQNTALYGEVKAVLLQDFQATPQNVMREIEKVGKIAQPDDRFVLLLAGHGDGGALALGDKAPPGAFAFVGPYYSRERKEETGVTGVALFNSLSSLPCRKVLWLDCCHSGSSGNLIRELTPSRVGPPMLMACEPDQEAWPFSGTAHGIFTSAVLDAFDEEFPKADADHDGVVTTKEVASFVKLQVPLLLEKARKGGDPIPAGVKQIPVVQQPDDDGARKLFGRG